jgi:sensor histidine kinase YesM
VGNYSGQNDFQYAKGLLIDLYRLHDKFIRDNIYTSVYQVVINQFQQCIYHPDIEKVGKYYPLPDNLFNNGRYNYEQFDKLHLAQSDYLQLPVFIEYSSMPFREDEWIMLSVSPGFEVKDMIVEQERNMILLFLLFFSTLLGILMFGILHWKREFLLRSSAEQENLNLLLKHEKQKSETISFKLELLRSGLNSHFMFNSLGTVKALLNKDDAIARKMLTNLSQLYRYQLRTEGEQMVTLREELDFTQTYVDVINLRMSSSIRLKINNLPDYLDGKVLPVSLQLLVENCIKHNIATEKDPLVITIMVNEGRIFVINELRPKVAIVETNGKGLYNLNTRYALITQQECAFKKENGQFIASIPVIN